MKPTNLEWEDVIQFEEVEGYGKSIWKNEDKYYLVFPAEFPDGLLLSLPPSQLDPPEEVLNDYQQHQ